VPSKKQESKSSNEAPKQQKKRFRREKQKPKHESAAKKAALRSRIKQMKERRERARERTALAALAVPEEAPRPSFPLVRVIARAVEVFGTSEKALRWINTPVRSLGDQTPALLLGSPEGITRVEDALGSIEHGVW
jgi:putative toxin-antitoxin system antitoxin component (TIGR02293 family)